MQTLTFAVPTNLTLHVTPEQFATIAAANRDVRLERTAEEKLIVNPPAGSESGRRNVKVIRYLDEWTDTDGGVCFDSSSGFTLPNSAIRAPDAAWISQDRWDAVTPDEKAGFALVLDRPSQISGEDILPGFTLDLRPIWS